MHLLVPLFAFIIADCTDALPNANSPFCENSQNIDTAADCATQELTYSRNSLQELRHDIGKYVNPLVPEILKQKTGLLQDVVFHWYFYHLYKVEVNRAGHVMSTDFGKYLVLYSDFNENSEYYLRKVNCKVIMDSNKEMYGADDWSGDKYPLTIPIFLGHGGDLTGHWMTIVVGKENDVFTIYYFDFDSSSFHLGVVKKVQEFLRVRTGFKDYIAFRHFNNPSQTDFYSCGMFTLYLMDIFSRSDISDPSVFHATVLRLSTLGNEPVRDARISVYNLLLSDLESRHVEIVVNNLPPVPLVARHTQILNSFIKGLKDLKKDIKTEFQTLIGKKKKAI